MNENTDIPNLKDWAVDPVKFMDSMDWPGSVRSYQQAAFYHCLRYRRMIHLWASGAGKQVFNAAYALWFAIFHENKKVLLIEPNQAFLLYSFGGLPQYVEEDIAIMHGMVKSLPENPIKPNWGTTNVQFESGSTIEVLTSDQVATKRHLILYDLVIINERTGNPECVDVLAPLLMPYVTLPNSMMVISTTGGLRDGNATLANLCDNAVDVTGNIHDNVKPESMFHISTVNWKDVSKEQDTAKMEYALNGSPYHNQVKSMSEVELMAELDSIQSAKSILEEKETLINKERALRFP